MARSLKGVVFSDDACKCKKYHVAFLARQQEAVFWSQGDCNVSSLTNQSSFYDPFDDSKHHDAENVANSSILWTMTGRSETNSAFNSFRAILLEPLRGPNGGPVKHDITLQATF